MKGLATGKIRNLSTFIDVMNKFTFLSGLDKSTTQHWYRGEADSNWQLLPQIYRGDSLNYFEREMVRDFKLNATELLSKKPEFGIDWLFLMQHYGLPTRLIDWSESYLIALFFAVLDYKNTSDARIWILNPWTLNSAVIKNHSVLAHSHPEMDRYCIEDNNKINRNVKGQLPIAIRPVRNSSRIIAQKGMFTIHGHLSKPLDVIVAELNEKAGNEIHLHSVIVDGGMKLQILKELCFAGVTYSVLFPEIQGICQDLKLKYCDDFLSRPLSFEGLDIVS